MAGRGRGRFCHAAKTGCRRSAEGLAGQSDREFTEAQWGGVVGGGGVTVAPPSVITVHPQSFSPTVPQPFPDRPGL
jgi:hypothetical protein